MIACGHSFTLCHHNFVCRLVLYFGYFTSTNYVTRPRAMTMNRSEEKKTHTHTINMKYALSKISCYSTRSFPNSIKLYPRREYGSNPERLACLFLLCLVFFFFDFYLCTNFLNQQCFYTFSFTLNFGRAARSRVECGSNWSRSSVCYACTSTTLNGHTHIIPIHTHTHRHRISSET